MRTFAPPLAEVQGDRGGRGHAGGGDRRLAYIIFFFAHRLQIPLIFLLLVVTDHYFLFLTNVSGIDR